MNFGVRQYYFPKMATILDSFYFPKFLQILIPQIGS